MKPTDNQYVKFSVNFVPEDLDALRKLALADERDVSYFVRKAVRAFLAGA